MTQSILVTGTSSGFGKLIVETLARSGHQVFASMRNTQGKTALLQRASSVWPRRKNWIFR